MNNTMAIKIERGYQSVEQARDIAAQKLRAAGYAVDAFGSSVFVNGFREEDSSLTMFNEAEAKEVIELFRDEKAAQDSHRPVRIDVVFDPSAPIEESVTLKNVDVVGDEDGYSVHISLTNGAYYIHDVLFGGNDKEGAERLATSVKASGLDSLNLDEHWREDKPESIDTFYYMDERELAQHGRSAW